MGERFSGVTALFDADNVHRSGVAPREEWMVLSKDWIVWTGKEIAEAAYRQQNPFIRNLGIILGAIAYRYTEMAETNVDNLIVFSESFYDITGGIKSCSPMEYALAVLDYTPLGECIVDQYRRVAGEQNDPTCERLLNKLLYTHRQSYR